MFKKIKYEADLVKRWFAAVEKNDSNNEGEIDLVLELMYYFDTKSNKKLLNKFEKLPYSKTFFEQERLRDVVLKGSYLKGSLGRELQEFWNQPTYSKDLVEDGLKIIKERKNDFTFGKNYYTEGTKGVATLEVTYVVEDDKTKGSAKIKQFVPMEIADE